MNEEDLKTIGTKARYLKKDMFGYHYNGKYPPDIEKYGDTYSGYPNPAAEVLFKDFAACIYDVEFSYHGKKYHLMNGFDFVALSDNGYTEKYQVFDNPNELIENLEIEGKKLIDILEDIDWIDPI